MSQFMDMLRLPNAKYGVAKGQFDDISHAHPFGAVPAMSQNQTGTIWDVNDTNYPWASWATAGTLSIPAVNASDNGKSITINGLDSNYESLSETVTVSSSAAVSTTGSFLRIQNAYMHNGSATNVGNINIQKGGTTVARITAGNGQTLMAIYTVPAGHTAYILQGAASCQSGADATGDMFVRYYGNESFRVGHAFEVSGDGGPYIYEFCIPVKIPEKSDIDVRASVRSNNARVTAAFDILLDYD
jgi:hypothetical protein